jgi:PhnB protein
MANQSGKSPDMQWINPYLNCRNITRAQKFYEEAFGFQTSMTIPNAQGEPAHIEMRHHDAVIMLGAEDPARPETKFPAAFGGSPMSLYVYVDDVDNFPDRIRAAGGEVVHEPDDKFWGDRMMAARCPEGYTWALATRVGEFDLGKAKM